MTPPPIVPPQYEPEQIRTLHDDEMRQQVPATRGTWLIAALLAVIAIAWILAVVLKVGR